MHFENFPDGADLEILQFRVHISRYLWIWPALDWELTWIRAVRSYILCLCVNTDLKVSLLCFPSNTFDYMHSKHLTTAQQNQCESMLACHLTSFSTIRQSERFGPKTLHLMIRPQGTEGSFVELRRRMDALSSVNCELQITIRTNQTYHIIPHDLEWPLEKKNTSQKPLVKRLLWHPVICQQQLWTAVFFLFHQQSRMTIKIMLSFCVLASWFCNCLLFGFNFTNSMKTYCSDVLQTAVLVRISSHVTVKEQPSTIIKFFVSDRKMIRNYSTATRNQPFWNVPTCGPQSVFEWGCRPVRLKMLC